MTPTRQLIIIYNANGTRRGKLAYAYRKLSSSKSKSPACAACDITHGGLSLKEVPGWRKSKAEIEAQGWSVIQWHRNEVEEPVREWISENGLKYPVALTRDGDLRLVANSSELAQCAGNATRLVDILMEKNVIQNTAQSSL